MIQHLHAAWEDFAFRPAGRVSLAAMRIIIAAQALWILLSRPDLPDLLRWPAEFWRAVRPVVLLRFGYFVHSAELERMLYVALLLLLPAVALGYELRVTALVAGLLLYHFAPLEEIFVLADFTSNSGLTIPTFALFILWAASRTRDRASPSSEFRWPVAIIQLFFALQFLFSGIAKLRTSGFGWYTGENIRQIALSSWALSERPLILQIGTSTSLSWAVALGSAALDFLFVTALISRTARWIFVPMAIVATIIRSAAFGYHWLSAPLLLLFVNWDRVADLVRAGRNLRSSSERSLPQPDRP